MNTPKELLDFLKFIKNEIIQCESDVLLIDHLPPDNKDIPVNGVVLRLQVFPGINMNKVFDYLHKNKSSIIWYRYVYPIQSSFEMEPHGWGTDGFLYFYIKEEE